MRVMPLTMTKPGESGVVKKVGGKLEIKHYLETLGFVVGASVTVVAKMGGNVIVSVKDSRIAINHEMAGKLWLESVMV